MQNQTQKILVVTEGKNSSRSARHMVCCGGDYRHESKTSSIYFYDGDEGVHVHIYPSIEGDRDCYLEKMQNEVLIARLFCEMSRHVMSSFFRVHDVMHYFGYDISKHHLLNITKYIDGVAVYQARIKELGEASVHVNVGLLFDTSYSIDIPIDDFCESAIIETEQKLLDHFVEKSKVFIRV